MSKINIVRSIKTKNIRDDAIYNREIGWDNRFHLAKLQPYDAYQDAYFSNMKILRDQFKIMEQSYQKPAKANMLITDRRFKASAHNRNPEFGSTNFGNSVMNNTNMHGSYNNFYNANSNNDGNIFINENAVNDPFIEEYNTIVSLWEDLGVTDNYKAIFENLSRDIDPLMKKDLFESEITSLRKFSDLLFKISKEIESREQIIVKIHVINENFLSSNQSEKQKDEILSEVVQNLKNIRITSINIINYLQKIRELCSYNVLGGKYNLDKINKVYKFDKNYLIKMKFDMDFLRSSKLAAYFEFEPCESDPFLLYFYFKDEKNEKKHRMQITEDLLSAVKQGQYLILQDLIFFNINSIYMKNLQKQERTLGKVKGIYGRDFSQPQKREARNPAATSSRLYSPPKKAFGFAKNVNNNLNDLRPSTSGFDNFAKNSNAASMGQFENARVNRKENENQFQATTNNFFKASNLADNKSEIAKKSQKNHENNLHKPTISPEKQTQINNKNNNDTNNITNYNPININNNNNNNIENNQNQNVNLNNQNNNSNNNINYYSNIQSEFLNPIQLQNQRGFSLSSKESKDVNIFLPNQINPNFNIINNPNNNFYDPYHNHNQNQQQMNLYPNQHQMQSMPYNFPGAYGYGFNHNPNMPLAFPINQYPYAFNSISHGFMPAVSANTNSHASTGLNAYAKENLIVSSMAKIEIIPNKSSNFNNVIINRKSSNQQNTDRPQENSRVIKVKTEEIVAIDKKDGNLGVKKTENNKENVSSSLSIKTDENAFENSVSKSNKIEKVDYPKQKEHEAKKLNDYQNDSYGHNSSIITKKLADDLSIQDEIEYKKSEKKITQKSLKTVNFKESNDNNNNYKNNSNYIKKNISIKKTESDIQEENNSLLNFDKFDSKKSLFEQQQQQQQKEKLDTQKKNQNISKSFKIQNSIDEEIQSEKDAKNISKRIPTEKSNAKYEDSFKKSFHNMNNSNISENLSYKASKKATSKKEIITNFNDFNNNKENSIDDIIDSKSLKEIENEINSDFKNDQPVIEESKKSIEVKDHSPKNLNSQPNRLATEIKYEKLEVINEESIIDKSKSNLREGNVNSYNNNKNNNNNKLESNKDNLNTSRREQQQQQNNSEIEEDYAKYNNAFEQQDSKRESRNDIFKKIEKVVYKNDDFNNAAFDAVDEEENIKQKKRQINADASSIRGGNLKEEENKENAHETFDSLKTHSVNSHKDENEENIENNYYHEDQNYNHLNNINNNNQFNEKIIEEHMGAKPDVVINIKKEDNYILDDNKVPEADHSKLSAYSSLSKKNKAAERKSHGLFEELKEKALILCKDEAAIPIKTEEPLEEVLVDNEQKNQDSNKTNNDNDNYNNNNDDYINSKTNKSIVKTQEAKPLESSKNQITEEEQVNNNNEDNDNDNRKSDNNFVYENLENKDLEDVHKHTEEIKEEEFLTKGNEAEKEPVKDIEKENHLIIKTENNLNNELNKKSEDNNENDNKNNESVNYDEVKKDEYLTQKNQETNFNKSIIEKKLNTEPNPNQEEEAEIEYKKTNTNKKTDPDLIEEENFLADAKNDELNKSFKSKKSALALKAPQQQIETQEKEAENKLEQDIIEEEALNENEIQAQTKIESEQNQHNKKIEIDEALKIEKKQSFSSLKNQIKISFLSEQQQITEFDLTYKAYKEKLNEAQKITFKPKDSIADYFSCFNPKIIKISNEANDLIGLCCISFDNTWEDLIKINLNQISFIDFAFFEDLLRLVLDFIKENFPADEILIDLHYEFKDANFEINTGIRDIFKNSFKFKWNKLENRNGERIQKMALALESASSEKKILFSKFMNCTLEVNHFSVMQLADRNNSDEINNEPTKIEDVILNGNLTNLNYFSLVSSLSQMHGNKRIVKSQLLEKYEKDKIKRLCRNLIVSINPGDEIDKEAYENHKQDLPEIISNELFTSDLSKNLSIMKLKLKFSSFSSHKFEKFIYNRIQGSISTLINEELNHEFHVILTSDGNYTVLITELNKGLKDFIKQNENENIYKLFDGLYNSLKNTHSTEEAAQANTTKSIWIPSFSNKFENAFSLSSNQQDENEQNLLFKEEIKNVVIENNETGEQKNIQNIKQAYNSIFKFDREYKNNPIVIPNENDIFIKDSFLISIINLDMMADSHISTVFLSVIDKDLWENSD